MNKVLMVIAATLISLSASADSIRLSEPVSQNKHYETFGSILNESLPALSLSELLEKANDNLGKTFLVETRIAKVCQKKGCFFIAQQNQHVVRVSFRDYGFFIPTDSSGKVVTLAGELIEKEVSEKQAAHFNADLNSDSESVSAGKVYEIVAESVRIPRSK